MQSMRRFGEAFRQLEWHDRLNVILATILELALVLVLSPILLFPGFACFSRNDACRRDVPTIWLSERAP